MYRDTMHSAPVTVNRHKQKDNRNWIATRDVRRKRVPIRMYARVGTETGGCLKVIMTTGGIVNRP
jgi:hypothetical protein